MEQDVILDDEIPDSDIEMGPIVLPRNNNNTVKNVKKAVVVRPNVPSFSFRKLRSKTFAQRHVYTVDLCKFLNLENEFNLEDLANRKTDEEVMEHLNRIYLRKKEQYDSKGLKRHKFTKPTFQIYVEDFKRYENNRQGKSFYDTIQDDNEESVPMHNFNNNDNNRTKQVANSPKVPKQKRDVDHLIPIKRGRSNHSNSSRNDKKKILPPAPELEFPDSSPPVDEQSNELEDVLATENIIEHHLSSLTEEIVVEDNTSALPIPDNVDHLSSLTDEIANVPEVVEDNVSSLSIPDTYVNLMNQSAYTTNTGRSLRQRKFSQNHVYTVDLCGYLGLLTRSELDSYSESGIPDEEIFQKLDLLYEETIRKHPSLKQGKFRFRNFLSHLEHHTKKYQRRFETSNQPVETFSSSQMVNESSSEEEEEEEEEELPSQNEESNDSLIALKQRRRLKGVLPFSYLKIQGELLHRRDSTPKHRINAPDRVGLAKKKIRKEGRSETFGDFIDDEEVQVDEFPPNDREIHHTGYETPTVDLEEISDSEQSSAVESDIEMFGPFSLSDSLFGLAEEDRFSGIDHMLSRSSKNPQHGRKSKSKKPRKYSINTNGRSKGTSTWSTNSKRIYRRRKLGVEKAPLTQTHIPFQTLALDYDTPVGISRPLEEVSKLKGAAQNRKSYHFPTSKNSSSKNSDQNGISQFLPGGPPKSSKEKQKKSTNFYGVAPDLTIHSLSRAPKSYTTQLEAQSRKYAVVNMQKHSRENLNPLEPPGIYTIPEDSPVDDIYEFTPFDSTPIDKFEELHKIHERGLQVLQEYLNPLLSDFTNIDTITYKLDGNSFILSKLNSNDSPMVIRRSFTLLKRYLVQKKNNNQRETEFIYLLRQLAKWLLSTRNISDQYALLALSELSQLLEVIIDGTNEIVHQRGQNGKFLMVIISLTLLNLIICDQTLAAHGSGNSKNTQITNIATRLIRSYLTYVFVCETPISFFNIISGSDSANYESLFLVGTINKYFDDSSFWSEVHLVFQKNGNSNEINRMVEYVRIFQSFTTEVDNHWKPIISILKFTKKLVGYSQLNSTKLVINLIFESKLKWDLDESIIVAVYGVLSAAKFRNFSGESRDLSLKFEVDVEHYEEDTILDSYFKLLATYMSKSGNSSTTLLEKIMPISSLDFEIQSDEVLINRVNVLLVYSNIFHQNFTKQLNILLKISKQASEGRLEIAFDAFCALVQINVVEKAQRINLDSIKDVVIMFVKRFNSNLMVKLDSLTIERNGNFFQKVIDKVTDLFEWEQLNKIALFQISCELFNLKFHATNLLDGLLGNVTVLAKTCVDLMELGNLDGESFQIVKNGFYESLTTLLGLQLSSFVPLNNNNNNNNNNGSYTKISNLVSVWCELSSYLVSQKITDWNSILFYHWNNIAGSSQREYFELQLLTKILDYPNIKELPISFDDIFLKALSKHIVKFNGGEIFDYLTKLISYYNESDILIANSFKLDTKQQFNSSRVQIVISYVYYLKKMSIESKSDFKKSELLMMELLKSLEREYEIQNRKIINFVWFCHFATKIVKFINYSCFELVKNSIEFSKLRSRLDISYHSDVDYAEKFKERLSSVESLEDIIKTIEQEILSSLIQGESVIAKFVDIFQSLIVDQLNNVYQKEEDSSSPLYPLTVVMISHLQILSVKNSLINWFMLELYMKITVECILQKGSLSSNDLICLTKMIRILTMIFNVEITTQFGKDYKNLILNKIYQLLTIVYNLLSTYSDQKWFSQIAMAFIELRNISQIDISQNIDYLSCIKLLDEDLSKSHDKVKEIINDIAKELSNNSNQIKLGLERRLENFKNLIKPSSSSSSLYIEF